MSQNSKDAEKKSKNPIGRPTKYDNSFCDVVVEKMKKGAAIKELPFYLGVCVDTINEWRKIHPDFSAAIKKGESFSEAVWLRKGRLELENPKFNSTLWYMNMKNRFGWSDKQESNHNVNVTETKQKIRDADSDYKY